MITMISGGNAGNARKLQRRHVQIDRQRRIQLEDVDAELSAIENLLAFGQQAAQIRVENDRHLNEQGHQQDRRHDDPAVAHANRAS
ncbi:hypothetical protein J2R97_001184 [Bradyrhizobium japonicum]|nr:hypothetical protein [Bradyrhizobium japonicum]